MVKIGIALTPFLYRNHSLEQILENFKKIQNEVYFETVELQFQKSIRIGNCNYSINDKKLRKLLPYHLKNYSFDWTFHDGYRLGSLQTSEFIERLRLYKKITKNPIVSFHFFNKGAKKEFLPNILKEGRKIRKKEQEARLYLENPDKQPLCNPSEIVRIVQKLESDGTLLDIGHYLDLKKEIKVDLPSNPQLIKYVHLSGCGDDLKRVYPKKWRRALRILKEHGEAPRHLPIVENSASLKPLANLNPDYIILEIDPKRLHFIGENIWPAYIPSLNNLYKYLRI